MPKGKGRFITASTLRNARGLRRLLTPAEQTLWRRLRRRQLGARFRRQHPLGRYVADFYCPAARLIIEVDGDVHAGPDQAGRDAERTSWLEARGYRILRFMNSDILRNTEEVLREILRAVGEGAKVEKTQ
jgi:very-short-patch-repair endonuclease